MALTPIKVLLFLAGGTVAAGATAYVAGVFEPYLGRDRRRQKPACRRSRRPAALPPGGKTPSSKPEAGLTPRPASPPAGQSARMHAASVRGSVLRRRARAGRRFDRHCRQRRSNAKVEAVIGSRVIGSAVAGPEGDFAIVRRRTTEARRLPDRAAFERAGQCRGNVAGNGRRIDPEKRRRSGACAGGGARQAVGTDHGSGAGQPKAGATRPRDRPIRTAGRDILPATARAENKPAATEDKPASQDNQQTAAARRPAGRQPADGPLVAVEAVEIEGRRVFVAGLVRSGPPGAGLCQRDSARTERDLRRPAASWSRPNATCRSATTLSGSTRWRRMARRCSRARPCRSSARRARISPPSRRRAASKKPRPGAPGKPSSRPSCRCRCSRRLLAACRRFSACRACRRSEGRNAGHGG